MSAAPTGLSKPMNLSAELEAVVGSGSMPRTDVTKALWVYIKENNLQDPEDKRTIVADDKLKAIFMPPAGVELDEGEDTNVDRVNMFRMTKLVSRHMT